MTLKTDQALSKQPSSAQATTSASGSQPAQQGKKPVAEPSRRARRVLLVSGGILFIAALISAAVFTAIYFEFFPMPGHVTTHHSTNAPLSPPPDTPSSTPETEKVRNLRKKVTSLLEEGQFDNARVLVMMDSASFSNQFTEARRQLLETIAVAKEDAARKKAFDAMMERKKAEELAEKALTELHEETAGHLLRMDFNSALKEIGHASAAAQTEEITSRTTALSNCVCSIRDYPNIIANSFRKDQGRLILVLLESGRAMTNTITAVNGERIITQQQIPAGWLEQTILVSELALSEKLVRLAEYGGDETVFARALLVYESGNPGLAIRILQDACNPFAEYIIGAIRKAANQQKSFGAHGATNQRIMPYH